MRRSQALARIQQAIRERRYRFAIPHFHEEMKNDHLTWKDVEYAMLYGSIRREFTDDPRGRRYEVVGNTEDNRRIAVICRFTASGYLLFITVYQLKVV